MFKDLLRQAMEQQGVSAAGLSRLSGIGKSSLSQYLSGKYEPYDKRKEEIAVALGLEPDYFKKFEIQEGIANAGTNLPVKTAAKLMGKTKEFVYQGLRDKVFPWGYAVKMDKKWSYYISPTAFKNHIGGRMDA